MAEKKIRTLRERIQLEMRKQLQAKITLEERQKLSTLARKAQGQPQGHAAPVELPPEAGQKDIEQSVHQTKTTLLDAGFHPDTVKQVLTNQSSEDMADLDLGQFYKAVKPVFDANYEAAQLTAELTQLSAEDGVPLEGKEQDALSRLVMRWGAGIPATGAKARKLWQRGLRSAGDVVGQKFEEGAANVGLGLSLLDFVSWINKRTKLAFVPQAQRATLEQRVLPKIKLDGEREFSQGTTAALYILGQRALGTAEGIAAIAFKAPALGIKGAKRIAEARGQVPALVSALGDRLSWQEVIETNWEAAGHDMDHTYVTLDDMGGYGDMVMANWAFTDAVAEIIADPFLIFGVVPAKLPGALRAGFSKIAPKAAVGTVSRIARQTYRFDDAVDAHNAAKGILAKAEKKAVAEIAEMADATGKGRLTEATRKQLIQARKILANEKHWMSQFEDPGPHEVIMLRAARRNPKEIPGIETTRKYVAAGPAITEEAEVQAVKGLKNELYDLQTLRNNMVQGKSRTPVTQRINDIKKEIEQIRAGQRSEFVVFEGETKPKHPITRIYEELHTERQKTLEHGADEIVTFDTVEDVAKFQRRQLMGPDDSEYAGDALNVMVRTGGVGVDDVMTTPMMPEYGWLPTSGRSLIKWNKFMETSAELRAAAAKHPKTDDLTKSTLTMLDNQLFIAKKNLGKAREAGDKARITLFDEEVRVLSQHNKNLKGTPIERLAAVYDDIWAPKATENLMDSPERFNKWLSVAADRVTRSLYPGGMQLNMNKIFETKGGQFFGMFREPQRFYETYAPGAWDRFRSGYLRYHQETRAWDEQITAGMEKVGIFKNRSKFNPIKDFARPKINEKQDELLFRLLNSRKESVEWFQAQKEASPALLKFHDEIRTALDHHADLQGISDTEKYLVGYIRHVFDRSQFAGGARPLEYIGLPAKHEVFASHLLGRTGAAGYKKSAALALEIYGRASARKRIVEPLYEDIISTGVNMSKQYGNPNFVTYSNDLVATMQGKPTPLGKRLDDFMGAAFNKDGTRRWVPQVADRALMGVSGLFWAGALPGNPRYPVMQIGTGIATTAGRFGMLRTSRGLFELATPEGQALNKQIGTYDTFLDIFESDFFRRFSTFISRHGYTVSPLGIQSTATTEEVSRGLTALAAVDMHLTKFGLSSWKEAAEQGLPFQRRIALEALRSAEEVNHMFGAWGRSPWATRTFIQSKGLAVAGTQFLSFIPKQLEELTFQFSRNPGNIATYLAVSGWISRLAAEQAGIDVTDYVGLGFLPKELGDISAPAVDAFIKNINLMNAVTTRDPQAVSDAVTDYLGALEGLLPLFVAFSSGTKSSEKLMKKQQSTQRGERLRPLDFADTLPGADASPQQFLKGIGESIRPETKNLPGLGGDLLPAIFGQQAIRDRAFQHGKESIRAENNKFRFNAQKVNRTIAEAILDGDTAKRDEAVAELENVYKIRIQGNTALEILINSQQVGWMLRELDQNQSLSDRYMPIIRTHGIGIER